MSKQRKKLKVVLDPKTGIVEIEQIGWDGGDCSGAIDDLIKAYGKEIKVKKKSGWHKKSVKKKIKKTIDRETR
jgi:hypothetical protein